MRQGLVLEALGRAGACLTLDELVAQGGERRKVASVMVRLISLGHVRRLERAGFVHREGVGEGESADLVSRRVTHKPWLHTRRQHKPTIRQRAWAALRILGKASVPELQGWAGDDVKPSNLQKYLHLLERAGFVQRLDLREPGTAPTSNGHVRWLLVRDSGPKAPVYRPRFDSVFDPNTREVHRLWPAGQVRA